MTYTYEFKIKTIVPYNINSQQRDIIEQFSWTITGTENGESATRGGSIMYDVAQGVAEDNFLAIDSITNSTLQTWVETEYGTDKINAMKQEIVNELANRPDDFNIIGE